VGRAVSAGARARPSLAGALPTFAAIDRCRAAPARLLPRRSIVTAAAAESHAVRGSRTSLRVAAVGRTFATAVDGATIRGERGQRLLRAAIL